MFEQHLQADEDQHDAACDLRRLLPTRAEHAADIQAGGGEQAGGDADDDHRKPDVERHECEAHADGEGVDAAGHGERQHVPPIEFRGLLGVLLFFFEGFAHHIAADQSEQAENDPMVHGGHVFAERAGREIAEQREKRLESAEPQGGFERIDAAKLLDGQAFANGDSERVHGHGHANKQNLNEHSW